MSVQVFSHPSKKVLVTGVSGTGKTTLFEKLLKKEKARWKFVFDHQGEFAQRFGHAACQTIPELCMATSQGGYVIFDPVVMVNETGQDGERRGLPGAFAFFCDFVFAISETHKGRKILACDELQKLVDTAKTPPELMTVLDTGRRYQLDFFAISQAPNLIHNAIRNQLTEVYSFRQGDDCATKFLADVGFPENEIRNLERFKYLWRNLATGENNFPRREASQPDATRSANPLPAGKGPDVESTGGTSAN